MNEQVPNKLNLAYVLPNLFTAASLFTGMIAVFYCVAQNFEQAAILIVLSLFLDGLDGRVARLTNTTSKFGLEFDSLADIVAFGVAPAVMFYYAFGHEFGKVGSLVAAIYVVFGAIRLARFNIMSSSSEPSVFIGVPIPTAAMFVSMWTLLFVEYSFLKNYSFVLVAFVLGMSILMVSNIRFPSFKKIDFQKANVIKVLIILISIFSLLYLFPLEAFCLLITSYIFYGIIRGFYNFLKFKKFDTIHKI